MTKLRRLTPFLFLCLLSMLIMPYVIASVNAYSIIYIEFYSPSYADQLAPISGIYKSTNTSVGAEVETFKPTTSGWVYQVQVYLSRFGNPNGFLVCYITGANGTFTEDNSTTTNEDILATSNYVNITSLSLNPDYNFKLVVFSFTLPNSAYLFTTETYALVIAGYNGTALNSDNAVWVGMNSAHGYNGDWSTQAQSAYSMSENYDMSFSVVGTTETFEVSPTPTPTGGGQAQRTTQLWTLIINVMFGDGTDANPFGLFIPLGMAILFCILGAKFAGIIGFIAGLNIAIVLSFLFGLLPLFTIIILLIVDAIYIYGRDRI